MVCSPLLVVSSAPEMCLAWTRLQLQLATRKSGFRAAHSRATNKQAESVCCRHHLVHTHQHDLLAPTRKRNHLDPARGGPRKASSQASRTTTTTMGASNEPLGERRLSASAWAVAGLGTRKFNPTRGPLSVWHVGGVHARRALS